MRILFITKLFTSETFGREPLGILYLSSALKKAKHKVDIADAFSYRKVKKIIKEFLPQVILFSIMTGPHQYYVDLNRKLKREIKVFSIFGGPHATFFPEIIEKENEIDAICIGEGEEAIVEFINKLEEKLDFQNTRNFWIRRNGNIFKNPIRPLIENLDSIEFPDRDLLQRYKRIYNFPIKSFITTRGCPYDCTYCYMHVWSEIYKDKGKRIRRRTVDNVIDGIKMIYSKQAFEKIFFSDDIFILSPNWLESFVIKYKKEIGVPFYCNARVDLVTEKVISLLKYAGCYTICMGVESGNDFIRNKILNREISKDQIINAAHIIKKYKIKLQCENILGIPYGNLETDLETVRLNIVCKPDYPASYLFQPYPRTVLGEIAIKEYGFTGNYDEITSYYQNTVLNIKNRTEIENLQKLFPFLIEFPYLLKIVRFLIKIPAKSIYRLFHKLWLGYCGRFRIMPYKFKIQNFILELYRFIRM